MITNPDEAPSLAWSEDEDDDEERATLPYADDERPTLPSEITLALASGRPPPRSVDTFADAFFAGGPAAIAREGRAATEIERRAHEGGTSRRREAIARGVLAVIGGCIGLLVAAFAQG
jgi:hypothetical protein